MSCCNIENILKLRSKLSKYPLQKYVNRCIIEHGKIIFLYVMMAIDDDNGTEFTDELLELSPCGDCVEYALKPKRKPCVSRKFSPLCDYTFSSKSKLSVKYNGHFFMSNISGSSIVDYQNGEFVVNNFRALGNKKAFKFDGHMKLHMYISNKNILVTEVDIENKK